MNCPNPDCKKDISILDNQCPYCGIDLNKPYVERRYGDASRPIWTAGHHIGQNLFKEAGVKDIAVEVDHWDIVNCSLINFGIPLINKLSVSNVSLSKIDNILINIRLSPDFGDAWEQSVDVIPPRKAYVAERINIPLSNEKLKSVKEAQKAFLKTEISSNGANLYLSTKPIDVMAYNEWYLHPLIADSLAGFIFPNCEEVEEVYKQAGVYLEKLDATSSFDGYQSKSREKVETILQALYDVLQNGLKIKYISPPASFERTGQKILFPSSILNINRGTCLDLALFYAACIERSHLYPLVFLVPGHALLGVWMSDDDYSRFWKKENLLEENFQRTQISAGQEAAEAYYRFLQERYEKIRGAIEEGMILPLNSTTFTKDADFGVCKQEGVACCEQASFDAIVDVKKVRPRVKPMSF